MLRTSKFDLTNMWKLIIYLCVVSGNAFNKHASESFEALLREVGQELFDELGLIIHKIFSNAATVVPYKDIFNDTEEDVNMSVQ